VREHANTLGPKLAELNKIAGRAPRKRGSAEEPKGELEPRALFPRRARAVRIFANIAVALAAIVAATAARAAAGGARSALGASSAIDSLRKQNPRGK